MTFHLMTYTVVIILPKREKNKFPQFIYLFPTRKKSKIKIICLFSINNNQPQNLVQPIIITHKIWTLPTKFYNFFQRVMVMRKITFRSNYSIFHRPKPKRSKTKPNFFWKKSANLNVLPKYVKLFDGSIGIIIELDVSVSHSKKWYSLNSNVAGYMIQQFFKFTLTIFILFWLQMAQRSHNMGGKNHFFTFYPVPMFMILLSTDCILLFDKRLKNDKRNSIVLFFPVFIITIRKTTAIKIYNFKKYIRTTMKKIANPNEPSMIPNFINYQPRSFLTIGFTTVYKNN